MDLSFDLDEYQKELEDYTKRLGTSSGYPCSCQESSILLHIWLRSMGIENTIVFGDYDDPVINTKSSHFWVEADDLIIDGTTIQFLLPNYERGYPFEYLKKNYNLSKCKNIFKKNNKRYSNKVVAYVPDRMTQYMELVIGSQAKDLCDVMRIAKDKIYSELTEDMKLSFCTSQYYNNRYYYELDDIGFYKKCQNTDREWVLKYVVNLKTDLQKLD